MNGEKTYKALVVGDVVGKCGRAAFEKALPELQWQLDVDFTLVNGENTSNGRGLNRKGFDFYRDLGVDAITLGNHLYGNREITGLLEKEERLARPANLPQGSPGAPYRIVPCGEVKIGVLNLLGRVYMNMPALDCPFRRAEELLREIRAVTPVVLVDFHAEATSEKLALARFLDGRVTAVFGTHTHVQTSDARILPRGTAYLSDVGMTGAYDSILGVESEQVIGRFLTGRAEPFQVAGGEAEFDALLLEFDAAGKALRAETIRKMVRTD